MDQINNTNASQYFTMILRLHLFLSSFLVFFQLLLCSAEPEVHLGTTLLAVTYKDGVVVGADTRTSVSGYVSNRFAYKIAPILDQAVICRSGSAADTQQLADQTKWELQARDYRYQMRPALTQISRMLRSLMLARSGELSASLICAGYDKEVGRGRIYSISSSGFLMEEEGFAISGSGSTFILGHMDNAYRPDMSEEDAVDFVVQAVQLAMSRDGSSGGFVRVHVLNEAGQKTLTMYPKDSNQKAPEARALPGFAKPKIGSKSKLFSE
jgi:20S proteasome subunit beta 1